MAGGLRAVLRQGSGLVAELLAPRRCALCGAFGPFVCGRCTASLPVDGRARCPWCMDPLAGNGTCHQCRGLAAPPLAAVTAAYRFDGGAQRLVYALKYGRRHAIGAAMGTPMIAAVRTLPAPVDVIVPVALHPRRERARGFNQAERLARPLGEALALPVEPRLLARVRHTAQQVRQPDRAARHANMDGAFDARAGVRGRCVLLVDDVTTTGATLRACAAALHEAGATSVQAVTFAAEG